MPLRRTVIIGLAGAAAMGAGPSRRALFAASLTGDRPPANTGSKATGQARIAVDLDARTVDLDLDVAGITLDQLWDRLTAAPVGPIHLHHYGSAQHVDDAAVTLVLPVPFGPAYADTPGGFRVTMRGYPYATGAAVLKSDVPFEGFVKAMQDGLVALNVHTDRFPDGEINGPVVVA